MGCNVTPNSQTRSLGILGPGNIELLQGER